MHGHIEMARTLPVARPQPALGARLAGRPLTRFGSWRITGWKRYWADNRWSHDKWVGWLSDDRVPLPRSFKFRAPIVCEMLGFKQSMYVKLFAGDNLVSESTQRAAMLAEVAAAVALGERVSPQIQQQAELLMLDRRAVLEAINYIVASGQPLTDEIRDLAADAILLDETDRAIEIEDSGRKAKPRRGFR